MSQVDELLKVVEEAQADKGNVVIVTGKPGSGKSKVLREAAEIKKWKDAYKKVILRWHPDKLFPLIKEMFQ